MLRTLNDLLTALRPGPAAQPDEEHAIQLATAALLIEVSRADAELGAEERRVVLDVLRGRFSLTADELERLVELATAKSVEAHDLFQFTRVVDARFDDAQKLRIVEAAWQVAFADGRLCAHEDHLMRRVADLLHVPRAASMVAKLRAERLAAGSAAPDGDRGDS
jgi:uncharacterized tellurite resistance protein B-like protein